MVRCGLCNAFLEQEAAACSCCGLAWAGTDAPRYADPRLPRIAAETHVRLSGGYIRFEGLILTVETLRILASRFDRTIRLSMGFLLGRVPARLLSAAVRLTPGDRGAGKPDVAFGLIARPDDIGVLTRLAATHGARFAAFAVMIDGSDEEAAAVREALEAVSQPATIRVAATTLNRDFGAQRNRLQRLAETRWVFHLDTDEEPDARLVDNLGWIVADAERYGNKVIGFPRLNLVDGKPSAFYPDVQFRLVRADVMFKGKVHESPLPGLTWRQVQLSLAGGIRHYLSRERVKARSVQYEDIAAGAGKPNDERLLLEEWRDVDDAIWN